MESKEFVVNDQKGILIVYEGISGSGKSENIKHVSNYLHEMGLMTKTVEWNANRTVRRLVSLLNRWHLLTPFLYSALQWLSFIFDYLTVIRPHLRKGHIVIADRYVYTALTRDAANGIGKRLGSLLFPMFRKPDWLLFFDTSPLVCYERIKARGKALFYTNKQIKRDGSISNKDLYYLMRLRTEYLDLFRHINERSTNIVFMNEQVMQTNRKIKAYILAKRGNEVGFNSVVNR